MISHPGLVETGLDLFDKRGTFNFSTLMFYQTGYGLFTLRQASRRAWRIGQYEQCRVKYFYYENSMQARAMTLMGRKLAAAEAIEGKFSAEGLAAMGGEDASWKSRWHRAWSANSTTWNRHATGARSPKCRWAIVSCLPVTRWKTWSARRHAAQAWTRPRSFNNSRLFT